MNLIGLLTNMYFVLSVFLILIILNLKSILNHLRLPEKKILAYFFILIGFYMMIYLFFIPPALRVFGDEPVLLASSIHYDGSVSELMLIKAIYWGNNILFSDSVYAVIRLNTVMSIALLIMLFILIYNLLHQWIPAMVLPLAVASTPQFMASAVSAYEVIVALFFLILALIFMLVAIRKKDIPTMLLFLISLMIVPLARIEYAVAIPVTLLYYLWNIREKGKAFLQKILLLSALVLCFIGFFYLKIFSYKKWYFDNTEDLNFSLINIMQGIGETLVNANYLVILFVFLIPYSIYWSYKSGRMAEVLLLISLAVSFAFVYLMNSYHAHWFFLPVFIFLGYSIGIPLVEENNRLIQILLCAVLAFILLSLTSYSIGAIEGPRYTDHRSPFYISVPEIINRHVDPDCVVITSYYAYGTMGTGINSFGAERALLNPELLEDECVYFLKDYSCILEEVYIPSCTEFYLSHDWVKEAIYPVGNGTINITLYRLS